MTARLVVVTGGTKGIGAAIARRFTAAGERVLAAGRADCDVTDERSVTAFFDRAGAVDVLVNNETDLTAAAAARIAATTGRTPAQAEAELAAATPLGRLLEPDEVAFAVAFLAAAEAGAINGQTLVLDGGGIQT